MFFLLFFLMIKGSGSVPRTNGSQKHTNPTDPDPQHCIKTININSVFLFILRTVTLNLQSSIVRQKKGFKT
jgi:hypothetical protein